MDGLISLVYAVKSQYRANGTFVMNSTTASIVRKLKSSGGGDYLWQPSSIAGQPDRLLGYPVSIWEQFDDVDVSGGSATWPIAFGNFRRAYVLGDRTDLRITVDPVTEPGFRKFYIRRRVYGNVADVNAVKFLRTSA